MFCLVVFEVSVSPVFETTIIYFSFSKAKTLNALNGRGLYRTLLYYKRKVKACAVRMQKSIIGWDWKLLLFFSLRWGYFGLRAATLWCLSKFQMTQSRQNGWEASWGHCHTRGAGQAQEMRQERIDRESPLLLLGTNHKLGGKQLPREGAGDCPWARKVPLWQRRPTALS